MLDDDAQRSSCWPAHIPVGSPLGDAATEIPKPYGVNEDESRSQSRPARIIASHLPLILGARLGVYEITAQIGADGMGEVYRATDTNLRRSVAIKGLPAPVAGDAGRLSSSLLRRVANDRSTT